jgi:hypothetical protein
LADAIDRINSESAGALLALHVAQPQESLRTFIEERFHAFQAKHGLNEIADSLAQSGEFEAALSALDEQGYPVFDRRLSSSQQNEILVGETAAKIAPGQREDLKLTYAEATAALTQYFRETVRLRGISILDKLPTMVPEASTIAEELRNAYSPTPTDERSGRKGSKPKARLAGISESGSDDAAGSGQPNPHRGLSRSDGERQHGAVDSGIQRSADGQTAAGDLQSAYRNRNQPPDGITYLHRGSGIALPHDTIANAASSVKELITDTAGKIELAQAPPNTAKA